MDYDCQSCGACCAAFRVSFYWSETDAHPDGRVPQTLTIPVTPHHVAMRGTDSKPVRCIGLRGEVGVSVACSIYEQRSSTCREFDMGSDDCLKARSICGLMLPPAVDEMPVCA